MPKIVNIRGRITRGDDRDIRFTVNTPRAISRARLTIKKHHSDPDSSGVLKQITIATNNPDGVITDQGGVSGVANLLFKFTKTETAAMTASIDYEWQMEAFDADNRALTPGLGVLQLNERTRTDIG